MGWFDDDRGFDPAQFQVGGGLYGRLFAQQPQLSFDQSTQGSPFRPVAGATSASLSGGSSGVAPQISAPGPSAPQPISNWPRDEGQTLNMRIGDYWMPQFGCAEPASPTVTPSFGDRLNAGFQSWAHTPLGNPFAAVANGFTGFNTGQLPGDQDRQPAVGEFDDPSRPAAMVTSRPRPSVYPKRRSYNGR